MIDFTSLFIIAGLLFGLLAGDAAIYGDTLTVRIAVADNIGKAGFTEATAEQVFTAEAARILRGESIIPAPALRVSSNPTVIAALAKPLNLDSVVAALQGQLGIDHLAVGGAIVAEPGGEKPVADKAQYPLTLGTRLDMVIIVVQPSQAPVQTVFVEDDGDPVTLVKRAAAWAMEQVSPYRVVLAHALDGVQGDPKGWTAARNAAQRFLAKPWDPNRASELAMTHNILALMAMNDGDIKAAEAQLDSTEPIPGVLPQVRSEIVFNQAFVAVAANRPGEAAALLRKARDASLTLDLPHFADNLDVLEGVVDWANGDAAGAEVMFRDAAATAPHNEAAHHYLAMLLAARGDAQGAAAEQRAAGIAQQFESRLQGLAVTLFWTDPVKGGVTSRL